MNFNNRNFVRVLCLIVIALIFGVVALNYPIGQLSRSGPGLFPVMVSSFLLLIGVLTLVRSHFVESVPLDYNVKNIAIVLAGFVGFAVASQYISMIVGIIFMVFVLFFPKGIWGTILHQIERWQRRQKGAA